MLSTEGEIIDFEAIIADSQDAPDTLEILWTSDIQGQLVGGDLPLADGTLFYSTANLSVGIHVITLMVTDTSRNPHKRSNLRSGSSSPRATRNRDPAPYSCR